MESDPTTVSPLDQLVNACESEGQALLDAGGQSSEAKTTEWAACKLANLPTCKLLRVAKSAHEAVRREFTGRLDVQYTDAVAEHDIAVFDTDDVLRLLLEVKRVKPTGNPPQVQVIQTFFTFVHDLLIAAIGRRRYDATQQQPVSGAFALVHPEVWTRLRNGSANPWNQLIQGASGWTQRVISIQPHLAVPDNGRSSGGSWPDLNQPSSLQHRHISMILTGSTSAGLRGVFRRAEAQLEIPFRVRCVMVGPSPHWVAVVCQVESVRARSSVGDWSWDQIEAWLP